VNVGGFTRPRPGSIMCAAKVTTDGTRPIPPRYSMTGEDGRRVAFGLCRRHGRSLAWAIHAEQG
jgi:hypothetical protein